MSAIVSNIGSLGFWLLAEDREYFVPFADYPVFQSATIAQIFKVRRIAAGQYHWPDLDADIELDALEHPEHYPLVWRDKRKRARDAELRPSRFPETSKVFFVSTNLIRRLTWPQARKAAIQIDCHPIHWMTATYLSKPKCLQVTEKAH